MCSLESSIAHGFITQTANCKRLTDEQVRNLLSKRAEEAKHFVTFEKLEDIVGRQLCTKMRNTNAEAGVQDLVTNYRTILTSD